MFTMGYPHQPRLCPTLLVSHSNLPTETLFLFILLLLLFAVQSGMEKVGRGKKSFSPASAAASTWWPICHFCKKGVAFVALLLHSHIWG